VNLAGIFLHKKPLNQAYFSKISIQNVEPNMNGKNEKTGSTKIYFIQKLRKIEKIVVSYPFTGNFLSK
jgi:hypothetical protein